MMRLVLPRCRAEHGSHKRGRRRSASGVTLVELMVSIAIGLLIVASLAMLFVANSRTRGEIERSGQQLESGRLAMELLRDDIHQAGYFGGFPAATVQAISPCVPRTGVALNAANLGWQTAPAVVTPLPIHGYASGDTPATETCISNQKADTDVLIVRSVEAAPLTLASATGSSFANDYFLQVSSCANAAVDAAGAPFVVAPGGAGAATRFTLHARDCVSAAPLNRLVVRAYYVGRCSVCTGAGDGIPSLRMVELNGSTATSASVVDGIESMRVEYLLDTAAKGQPDSIRRCKAGVDGCTLADWTHVSAVQVYLLARNLSPSPDYADAKSYAMGLAGTLPPAGDRYKRRLYSALIVARNLAGPREH